MSENELRPCRSPLLDAVPRWVEIKSEDDLPKESGEYLVTIVTKDAMTELSKKPYVTSLKYFDWSAASAEARLLNLKREHWLPASGTNWHVTAWQPLPAPYTGPKEKGK